MQPSLFDPDPPPGPAPVPARITMALDAKGLYGPEVDLACGAREPDVDRWEAGTLIPTAVQLRLLAELTGQTVGFFFEPMPDLGTIWICQRSRRPGNRCKQIIGPLG